MSDQWTPSTEQVRRGYATDPESEYRDPIGYPAYEKELGRAFNRWLAETIAIALEEAADWLDGDSAAALWEMWDTARNQYTTPTDALRARATQIREEGRA